MIKNIIFLQKTLYVLVISMFIIEISISSTIFSTKKNVIIIDGNHELNKTSKTHLDHSHNLSNKLNSFDSNKNSTTPNNLITKKYTSQQLYILEYVELHPEENFNQHIRGIKKYLKNKGVIKSRNDIKKIYKYLEINKDLK